MGYSNVAADMQDLLSYAKWLLAFETFADLRAAIAEDEISAEDREDDEFGSEAEAQYREIMVMNAHQFMTYLINNSLADAQMDRDFTTLAYVTMTMARVRDFIDATE